MCATPALTRAKAFAEQADIASLPQWLNDQQASGEKQEQQHDATEARLIEPTVKLQSKPCPGDENGQAHEK